ncbi:MAG: esterase-like activity of phytase family protein [Phycisphaerales bacterium]|nr:esterase-like activity of phytase family protein [Phycisphaerales bacterium]
MMQAAKVFGLVLSAACALGVAIADVTITYGNSIELPAQVTDQHAQAITLAGLSGLTALPDGRFAAVMDNGASVVFFRPVFNGDGTLASVTQSSGLTLSESRDFEDIALIPGTISAALCDEGTAGPLTVADLTTGAVTPGPAAPAVFANVRPNFGLESVTVSPDGLTLWTCNEEALSVDGAQSTSSAGTRVRLQRFSRGSSTGSGGFAPSGQWCYITQPMHGGASVTGARCGVSALVALPGGGLLAMERSFALSASGLFLTRIYAVSTAGATDTSAMPALASVVLTPCGKQPLFAGYLYNLEGLALGPAAPSGPGVPAGRRVLLGVTDSGDPLSTNRLHVFFIDGLLNACGVADLGSQGAAQGPDGTLDNNDFIVFINAFFATSPSADLGHQGGLPGGDGAFDNNDFIAFINAFFAGC